MRRHVAILSLLIGIISAILVALFLSFSLVPLPASSQARSVDTLFKVLFSILGVIFALVMVLLLYSLAVFRRRPGDTADGPPIYGHTPLETAWTLIPLAIVISLGVYGGLVLADITRAPDAGEELEVDVIASQWAWLFRYPEFGITSPELALPVGRPVLFRLTSRDVIHSFWVPEFRLKQDAVPGMETHLRITPTKVGDYTLRCAELCGLGHAYMAAPVKVLEEAEFLQWVQDKQR